MRYSIEGTTLKGLADAVRYRTGKSVPMTSADMVANLESNYFLSLDESQYAGVHTEWERPSEWPDLDSLPLDTTSTTDTIYMTYDADKGISAVAWHIDTLNSTKAVVDIGHIENGVFVSDDNTEVGNNTNFIKSLAGFSGLVVVRITGQLTHCYGINATIDGATQNHRQQPMLERVAHVPNLLYLTPHATNNSWGQWMLEREKISNGSGESITNMMNGWTDCRRLRQLDLSGFNTPNVTNMSYTFSGCMSLAELNLSHLDVSKVANFSYTFNNCSSLNTLNLTGWNTEAATNMAYMFAVCARLHEILGVEDFDVHLVTSMSYMFSACIGIKKIDLSAWNPQALANASYMFNACRGMLVIDLHGVKAPLLTNASYMFINCHSAKIINLDGFETGNVTTVAGMFNFCYSVQELDISGIKVTSACTSIYFMFNGCWSLKRLDFPEWDVSGLGSGNNTANSMFLGCYSLEYITGIENWDFQLTNSLGSMFSGCQSLRELDVSGWNVSTVTSFASMFANCWNLRSLDLSGWNPANCASFASMFSECHSLESVGDLSGWNTAKVTTLASMFNVCLSLKTITGLSSWNVEKVTTAASMFMSCRSLREVEIKNWNLAVCTTIATMFRYCYNLRKATLTGWSLPKLTSTAPAQFLGDCWTLEDVDPPAIPLNHSYAADYALTHEALIKIINSLPTVGTKRTLNLTATNMTRLTADEKAVATAKNWTLAN